MSTHFVDVFLDERGVKEFTINNTIPEVKEQEMVRTCHEDRVLSCVRGSPYLLNYTFCNVRLQEFSNLILGNNVKWVSVFKIFLKQKEPHLSNMLYFVNIRLGQCWYLLSNSLAPNCKLVELDSHQLQNFNEQASSFDNIGGLNEDIKLSLLWDLILNSIK